MRKFLFVGLLGLSAAFWSASCQGPDELYRNGGISVTGAGGTISPSGGGGTTGTTGIAGTTGRAGTTGSSGASGTTGRAGTSGSAGSSGNAGTNGSAGTSGGTAGTTGGAAGTTGTGSGGAGGAKNCIDAIKLNGYAATGAPPCSACKDNQTDESAKCEAMIDCEDAAGCPGTGGCVLTCSNSAGASSVEQACVSALVSASCGS